VIRKLLLPFFWGLSLFVVVVLSDSFTDKSLHFFGIAGEREQSISFQYPVEIVQVFVAEGKNVEQGELMLEVKRHELDHDLTVLAQEIGGYELQKQKARQMVDNQLAGLHAKKQVLSADMDYQIHALELKLKMNVDMVNSISVLGPEKVVVTENVELNDLKRKRYFLVQGVQAEIDQLTEQSNAKNHPIDAQLLVLLQRREELLRQNVNLKVSAQFDGRVGSVYFKTGELVSPFQPIISVHSRSPRHIKGYIHENILNDVQVGQVVWVKSIAINQSEKSFKGVVDSLGNRIVEYPDRLKKNPLVPAWGREIRVRLETLDQSLLFGEKVQVFLESPEQNSQWFSIFSEVRASGGSVLSKKMFTKIESSNANIHADKIEASGILWNPKEAHYLLVSDEQYKHQTSIFIMQEMGVVFAKLALDGGDIDDLESISSEGDYIYVLSSLSHSKRDRLKDERKKLMRFRYQGQRVTEQQNIDLYAVLKKLSKQSSGASLALFLKQAIAEHNLDIESHLVLNNALYLGFKSPFVDSDKALIIKVTDVNTLFDGAMPKAEIWRTINLPDPETGEPMQLSDMIQASGQWFFLSVSRGSKKKSVLWHYQPEEGLLKQVQQFSGVQAEGIAYRSDKSLLSVVFDEGNNKSSRYLSIPFSGS